MGAGQEQQMNAYRRWMPAAINGLTYNGWLTIEAGRITYEPSARLNVLPAIDPITHTKATIVLIHARFMPPWFNSSLTVHGRTADGRATAAEVHMPGLVRRQVKLILDAAGFEVKEVTTRLRLSSAGC